jgi:hypothetical protein
MLTNPRLSMELSIRLGLASIALCAGLAMPAVAQSRLSAPPRGESQAPASEGGLAAPSAANQLMSLSDADAVFLSSADAPQDDSVPRLRPGNGFAAREVSPGPIGDPRAPGYGAKPMARWNTVPFQTVANMMNVGVVAFHINGIDRVEFSANGGPWVAATEAKLNPQTRTMEYFAQLRARDFQDAPVEIRAIVYPKVGTPRVLAGSLAEARSFGRNSGEHSMWLTSNGNRTLRETVRFVSPTGSDESGNGTRANPFATIYKAASSIQQANGNADGGMVYLLEGEHTYPGTARGPLPVTRDRYLTIASAPGTAKGAVKIVRGQSGGMRNKLTAFRNVAFVAASVADQNILRANSVIEDYLWLDGCKMIGPGRATDGTWGGGFEFTAVTNSMQTNARGGFSGDITRNVRIAVIGSDAFSGKNGLIVNCKVDRIDGSGTLNHPDVLQYQHARDQGPIENCIVYGLRSKTGTRNAGQGLYAGREIGLKDVAYVDVQLNNQYYGANEARAWQFMGPVNHMLLKDSVIVGGHHWRSDTGFTARDVVVENTYKDEARSQFFVPFPDRTTAPARMTAPWTSPLGVVYREGR